MRITDINRTKKGRWSIFVEGEFACALHEEIFAASGLSAGQDIDSARLGQLYRESQLKITRERAMSLLARQSYTAKGLYDKLAAYADEESAEAAVLRMQELGLVNDREYARRYAADCVNLRHFSLSRTARALGEKGIDREIIDEITGEMEQDTEAAIARVVLRKYYRGLGDEKGERRAVNGLLRLGYRYGDIRLVMANLLEDPDWYSSGE